MDVGGIPGFVRNEKWQNNVSYLSRRNEELHKLMNGLRDKIYEDCVPSFRAFINLVSLFSGMIIHSGGLNVSSGGVRVTGGLNITSGNVHFGKFYLRKEFFLIQSFQMDNWLTYVFLISKSRICSPVLSLNMCTCCQMFRRVRGAQLLIKSSWHRQQRFDHNGLWESLY